MPGPVTWPSSFWRIRGRSVPLARPLVFGILNVTPDSFSDGGRFASVDQALDQARRLISEGADGIDVGGESTRPQSAAPISREEELRRVVPVLEVLRSEFPAVILSIDTSKADVARTAVDLGADVINDVSGFRIDPRIGEIAASTGAGVVVMHSRGGVSDMGTYQHAVYGDDVVGEVVRELRASLDIAVGCGVDRHSIVLDPGIGFAKRSEHSLVVLAELHRIRSLGFPVMVGVSRKRFIGELSGVDRPSDRVAGTVGANVAALMRGASLFRVHDMAANRQALDVAWAIVRSGESAGPSRSAAIPDSRFPIPDPGGS